MLKSQEHLLKLSELREQINGLAADATEEARAALTAEYNSLEAEYRAAVKAEDAVKQEHAALEDGQPAEIRQLWQNAEFGNYILASAGRRGVDGAERELNAALGIGELNFPLDFIAPAAVEERAAINGDAETNQGSWLDRVFHDSAAQRLGITFRSVSPGIAAYPVTTGGGASQQRGRTEGATARTLTVAVSELKPTRRALHFVYSIEDVARLPGLADAIQRDMQAGMMEDIDKAIFVGDSGANENTADITGLTTLGIDEKTLTQANKVKGPETLTEFVDLIDGQYAASAADLRIVAAEGANKLWLTTLVNSAVSNETLAQFLRTNGLSWSVRGDIETDTGNNDFGAFIGLARGIEGAAVAPVWQQASLITDPYSGADQGEVELTLNYLWNFGMPRTANYKRLKFVT